MSLQFPGKASSLDLILPDQINYHKPELTVWGFSILNYMSVGNDKQNDYIVIFYKIIKKSQ